MSNSHKFNDNYPSATSFFNNWAEAGKDVGMEKGHADSVAFMYNQLEPYFANSFSALDVGCGNGWVVRKFKGIDNCQISVGIDGAEKMIKKAQSIDSVNDYICADILNWAPSHLFNIIHSMEVLYYLENPSELINTIYTKWLNQTGCFIFGIDHYTENLPSINWPSECGINMNTQPIDYWLTIMEKAGFKNIQHWQCLATDDWMGTLVIMGEK